ncbi:MAG: hypothetical protein AAF533_03325 [Acidobacteriota bacterium]
MGQADLQDQVLAIMKDLELPSPESMLRRIERMLPAGERDRVFQALVEGSTETTKDDRKKLLKALDGSREDWSRAVDGLLERCSPTS